MSAGSFTITKYSASYGTTVIHPIRVQPETIAAAIGSTTNAAPTGAINVPIRVSVKGGRRSNGIVARHITAKIAGTPPDTYSATSRITIPALTENFYNAAVENGVLTYLGTTWTITGKRKELTGNES